MVLPAFPADESAEDDEKAEIYLQMKIRTSMSRMMTPKTLSRSSR